ncbi:MAG: hypothetical protein V1798_03735 [Pseudomonadota bacterium]
MRSLFIFLIFLAWPVVLHADESFDEIDFGAGFVSVEAGKAMVLGSGQHVVTDPVLLYVLIGLNLRKEFGFSGESDSWISAFKLGGGGGTERATGKAELFYDLLVKIRYTFFSRGVSLRPYLEAGPGLIKYVSGAFELEGGGGLNFHFGSGFAGAGVQYKRLFKSDSFTAALGYFGELGYQF